MSGLASGEIVLAAPSVLGPSKPAGRITQNSQRRIDTIDASCCKLWTREVENCNWFACVLEK